MEEAHNVTARGEGGQVFPRKELKQKEVHAHVLIYSPLTTGRANICIIVVNVLILQKVAESQ